MALAAAAGIAARDFSVMRATVAWDGVRGDIHNSFSLSTGDILAATKEDVDLVLDAARRALSRNKGRDRKMFN
ncbi:betaine aldehyde dehydrogenase 1, chloroplastic isoform X2 [Sesbania bispinosa]|nr:betaine aldehyde dehydrogenase 1, chloroplastic isoform X2 [Sesbania bispinosa]